MRPDIIFTGSKVMMLDVPEFGIKFRDSLSYVPMSLASWGISFGLPETKTHFPHSINNAQYWGKTIPYPDKSLYNYGNMSDKERERFCEWYINEKQLHDDKFEVNQTLADYCAMDVTSLRLCCQQFRKMFMELSEGICPFSCALTLPGLCNYYWRARILEEKLLAVVAKGSKQRTSVKGQKWLAYVEWKNSIELVREHKISKAIRVDGFCKSANTVYEFDGTNSAML
jgi:hypothetical protein